MSTYVLISIVFVTLFFFFLAIFLLIRRASDPAVKRIRELDKSSGFSKKKSRTRETKEEKVGVNEKIGKVIAGFGQLASRDKEKISALRKRLIRAGYPREDSARIFIGLKMLSAVIFFFLFIYLGFLGERSLGVVLILSLLIAVVGYRAPDLVISMRIHRRQEQIAGGLPDALDLLVISVEAGLGLNAALLKVGEDLILHCPAMAEEFIRVNQDLRTGASREEALRNLSERNEVEDLNIFVSALILADRLGTSIADTLRAQADSLRTRIRQKAEEQAAKASIRMLLPLVLFILPALIIILMGPGLISVYRTFNP